MKKLISTMMESPPPSPPLYCISQASPIMGFTLRPVTRGGGPAPLLTMAPWGPRRLRCCTVSMPPPPATPPYSTYTARISLRTQGSPANIYTRRSCFCAQKIFLFDAAVQPFSPLSLRVNKGTNPSRPGGFPGANSPGPVADLYGPSNQDSAVGNYISAASPQPGSGFGPSITIHC
ncbi:hypothetical protein GOODEAATRI_014727 [Goodea atripinnis]|uniref:Uncharacterized protein n=1 Tax=Goodea atripinnis TaxID=208336 RepID=A0ABV0MHT4_9TELE